MASLLNNNKLDLEITISGTCYASLLNNKQDLEITMSGTCKASLINKHFSSIIEHFSSVRVTSIQKTKTGG